MAVQVDWRLGWDGDGKLFFVGLLFEIGAGGLLVMTVRVLG